MIVKFTIQWAGWDTLRACIGWFDLNWREKRHKQVFLGPLSFHLRWTREA